MRSSCDSVNLNRSAELKSFFQEGMPKEARAREQLHN
jgi:hypothetical protein